MVKRFFTDLKERKRNIDIFIVAKWTGFSEDAVRLAFDNSDRHFQEVNDKAEKLAREAASQGGSLRERLG